MSGSRKELYTEINKGANRNGFETFSVYVNRVVKQNFTDINLYNTI